MQLTDKITLINEDNMELMSRYPDNYFDLAIVDPPYGMRGNVFQLKSKQFLKEGQYSARLEDKNSNINYNFGNPPGQEYFNELIRVSKNQIIFGMQYFIEFLPSHQCVIVWDKLNGKSRFSDAEIIYTSFDFGVRIIKKFSKSGGRRHPTQKPVYVYEELIKRFLNPKNKTKQFKILDTHVGSGSIVEAVLNSKEDILFVGCEINEDYYRETLDYLKKLI